MASGKSGYSETYWNLHRNSLVFSLAWIAASVPGVCLSDTQTWALVTGHIWQPLLQLFLSCAALYCYFAFAFEWRHEALSQFRTEVGRAADLPGQISELVVKISEEIKSADAARSSFARSIEEARTVLNEHLAINIDDSEIIAELTTKEMNNIINIIDNGNNKIATLGIARTLSTDEMLRHAEIAAPLYNQIRNYSGQLAQSIKVREGSIKYDVEHWVAAAQGVSSQDSQFLNELSKFESRWADFGDTIKRHNRIASLRTWIIGIWVPTILLLIAVCHGFGAWGINLLPFPPITQIMGQPEACVTQQ